MAWKERSDFCEMMAAYIQKHFSGLLGLASHAETLAWVWAALATCERHDVTTEPEAAQLMLFFLVIKPDEGAPPWVREILEDGDMSAAGKIRRLLRDARERGIDEIDEVVVYDDLEDEP